MVEIVKKRTSGIRDSIAAKDIYGKPIVLNYNGDESFKTCPGGMLSIFVILTVFVYMAFKSLQMI